VEIVVAVLSEPAEELILNREEQPGGEHPEIGVELLAFGAVPGGSHNLRQ
jgi:hypothetical protein